MPRELTWLPSLGTYYSSFCSHHNGEKWIHSGLRASSSLFKPCCQSVDENAILEKQLLNYKRSYRNGPSLPIVTVQPDCPQGLSHHPVWPSSLSLTSLLPFTLQLFLICLEPWTHALSCCSCLSSFSHRQLICPLASAGSPLLLILLHAQTPGYSLCPDPILKNDFVSLQVESISNAMYCMPARAQLIVGAQKQYFNCS